MKNYTKSPLPFQRQKRGWYNTFTSLVNLEFSQTETFVDLFGGSGILSQFVRQTRPDARVIWNDYDNFNGRIKSIPQTNDIIKRLRDTCRNYKPMQRLSKETAQKCIEIAKEADDIYQLRKKVFLNKYPIFAPTFFEIKKPMELVQVLEKVVGNDIPIF